MGSKLLALMDDEETIKHTYSILGSRDALIEIITLWFHPNIRRLLNIVSNKQPQYNQVKNLTNLEHSDIE